MENLKFLFQLYFRPLSAMSDLLDKGSWLMAAIFVLVVSIGFYWTVNSKLQAAFTIPTINYQSLRELETKGGAETIETVRKREAIIAEYEKRMGERNKIPILGDNFFWLFSFEPTGFLRPLISLAVFYVPLTILLLNIFAQLGSFSVIFGRDYGSLSVCAFMAWAASHLPFALAGILLFSQEISPNIYLAFWFISGLWFGILMIFALRVVFGVNYRAAFLTIAISWIGISIGMFIFKFISPFFFSPFLLIMAYMYFGGAISGGARGLSNSFRQQQDFKRHLQTATINPKDADAHVQLGLIYNQRRQTEKALEHFTKAFEIDKNEPDANYELGKIARQKGELQKAIEHFSVVVEQNEKFSLNEIWREIGATYLDAKMLTEARNALETFVERRPYDPEGLYYYGKVLQGLGEKEKAREQFEQAIESAKNSPDFRRRELKQWGKLAEKEL